MIIFRSIRNGEETVISDTRKVMTALNFLLTYDLGCGGRIIEFTETRIVVKTSILSSIDITSYSGTKEDMALLVKGAAIYLTLQDGTFDQAINNTIAITKGIPLFVTAFNGGIPELYSGIPLAVVSAAVATGFDESQIKRLLSMRKVCKSRLPNWDDAWAYMELYTEVSPEEFATL